MNKLQGEDSSYRYDMERIATADMLTLEKGRIDMIANFKLLIQFDGQN